MTCSQWQFLLATAEGCGLVRNALLQAHLSECSACAEFARGMQALSRAVRSLSSVAPPSGFRARVRERIDGSPVAAAARPTR